MCFVSGLLMGILCWDFVCWNWFLLSSLMCCVICFVRCFVFWLNRDLLSIFFIVVFWLFC